MHYVPHVDYAFLSVEHIMRDVNNGWMFRYIHANGASMMFIALYVHMFFRVRFTLGSNEFLGCNSYY